MPVMKNMTGNIFLVGLMGSGKSTLGRLLAKKHHKPFIDTDHLIEERLGVSIATIFDIEGELGFRQREAKILQEICASSVGQVIATGGGIVLREENRQQMRQAGIVVYLKISVDDLVARVRYDTKRPLLQQGNKRDILTRLCLAREPLYAEVADVVLDSSNQSASAALRQLEELLMLRFDEPNESKGV
jgi:shikimate kinase